MRSKLEEEVIRLLLGLGINGMHGGFHYMKTAILVKMENQAMKAKEVVERVARIYDEPCSRVSLCMTACVERADDYGTLDKLNELYGAKVILKKVTLSKFLNLVTLYLLYFQDCALDFENNTKTRLKKLKTHSDFIIC